MNGLKNICAAILIPLIVLGGCGEVPNQKYQLMGADPELLERNADASGVTADSKNYVSFSRRKVGADTHEVFVVGPEVVIAEGHENRVYEQLNNIPRHTKIHFAADRLIVRDPLFTSGADVEIAARELVFENERALINTVREEWKTAAAPLANGRHGYKGGDITLRIKEFQAPEKAVRFVMTGGKGEDPGLGKDGRQEPVNAILLPKKEWKCRKFHKVYCQNKTGYSNYDVYQNAVEVTPDNWPSNGESATAAGIPGSGGAGGTLFSTIDLDPSSVSNQGGLPGKFNNKVYRGGPAGTPALAIQLKWEKKQTYGTFSTTSWIVTTLEAREVVAGSDAQQKVSGKAGAKGEIKKLERDWYSPEVGNAVYQYIDDLYFQGLVGKADAELRKQLSFMESAERALSSAEAGEVLALKAKFSQTLGQIQMQKDYFGNPMLWVPPLSFESYVHLYQTETKSAIRRLYLTKRLLAKNRSVDARIKDVEANQADLREEIESMAQAHAEAMSSLPEVQTKYDELLSRSENVRLEFESIGNELEQIANKTVRDRHKVPWWKKGLSVLGRLAQSFPVGQPFVGMGGAAAVGVAEFKADDPLASVVEIENNVTGVIGAVKAAAEKKENDRASKNATGGEAPPSPEVAAVGIGAAFTKLKDRQAEVHGAGLKLLAEHNQKLIPKSAASATGKKKSASEKFMEESREKFMAEVDGDLGEAVSTETKALKAILEGVQKQSVPQGEAEQIQAEIAEETEKLKEESPRFREVSARLEKLNEDKTSFLETLNNLLNTMAIASATSVSNLVKIAELAAGVEVEYETNLTPKARVAVEEMQKRAVRSLRKFHYYFQKAFKYRLLEQYPGHPDLQRLFERIETLIAEPGEVLTRDDYDDLFEIYHEEVSKVLASVMEKLDRGDKEFSDVAFVHLSKGELDSLSAGGMVPLNLLERMCTGTSQRSTPASCIEDYMEDVRITEIAAESFTLAENSAVPPHFRINVDHSGLSKFWRDAELQMFRLSQENSQANRSWRSTLYENGTIRTDGPSDAFVSLIKAFIPAAPSGSTVFATSSAWEDLNIYLRTSAAERPVLDTLVLRIVYTYRDQAPGKKSWRAHLLGQNQRIIAAYEKAGLGVPGGTVLAAGRNLLDLGYAPEAVARRAVELRSVEEVED